MTLCILDMPNHVRRKIDAFVAHGKSVRFAKQNGWTECTECCLCGNRGCFYVFSNNGGNCDAYCTKCGEKIRGMHKENRPPGKRPGAHTQRWVRAVRERYNNECALCGCKNNLEVHHIVPYSVYEGYRYNVNNGILLCHECHKLAHKRKEVKHD